MLRCCFDAPFKTEIIKHGYFCLWFLNSDFASALFVYETSTNTLKFCTMLHGTELFIIVALVNVMVLECCLYYYCIPKYSLAVIRCVQTGTSGKQPWMEPKVRKPYL